MRTIPLSSLVIPENRQRRTFDPQSMQDLVDSIGRLGLLQPIVIRYQDEKPTLAAGERRLRAIKDLWALGGILRCNDEEYPEGQLPCLSVGDLDYLTALEVEIEENIRRVDFTWQERDSAIAQLHRLRQEQAAARGEEQTIGATAAEVYELPTDDTNSLGTFTTNVSRAIRIAAHLADPDIQGAKSSNEAFKILVRKEEARRNAAHALVIGRTFGAHSHALYMGDCRELLAEMDPELFDCICTDPPYGMGADDFGDAAGKLVAIDHDYDDSKGSFTTLMADVAPLLTRVARPQAHLYMCCDIDNFHFLKALFQRYEWQVFRTPLINCKIGSGRVPLPEHGPRRQYETILYAFRGGKRVTGIYSDVISTTGDENLGHGAQKPVALFQELLKRSTRPGSRVIDPFAGTGTIFPAAHALQCEATGIEREAAYYGIAARRIETLDEVA